MTTMRKPFKIKEWVDVLPEETLTMAVWLREGLSEDAYKREIAVLFAPRCHGSLVWPPSKYTGRKLFHPCSHPIAEGERYCGVHGGASAYAAAEERTAVNREIREQQQAEKREKEEARERSHPDGRIGTPVQFAADNERFRAMFPH